MERYLRLLSSPDLTFFQKRILPKHQDSYPHPDIQDQAFSRFKEETYKDEMDRYLGLRSSQDFRSGSGI